MRSLNQDEVNKACRGRSFKLLDEVLFKIELEIMAVQEEFNELSVKHNKPLQSQTYEMRVLKYNRDRINKRILELGERSVKTQQRRDEEKAKNELYIAYAKSKMQMHTTLTEMRLKIDPNAPINTGDKVADKSLNYIKSEHFKGKSFADIAREAKKIPQFSIKDLERNRQSEDDLMNRIEVDDPEDLNKLINEINGGEL